MPFTWWNRLFPRARSFSRRTWRPLERLEDRTTPVVTALPPVAGLLTVGLSAAGDEARLGVSGANLEIRDGTNALILSTPAAGVTSLSFLGVSAGNQTVVWNDTVAIAGSATLAGISTFTINGTYSIGTTLTATLGGPGAGGISDGATGNLTVIGLATLNAAGRDVAFDNPTGHNFSSVAVSGQNVALVDGNAIDLGAASVTGNLTVTAGGPITDSSAIVVNGTAFFSAGANAITLDNANDFQGNLSVGTASAVTVRDLNDLALGLVNATGTVALTAGGAITDGNGALPNVVAAALAATATTGIGSGDALEMAVGTLAAVDTLSGSFQIANTGALTIGTVGAVIGVTRSGAAAGSIQVGAASPLTIDAPVINSSGGDIVLTAANDGGNDDNLTVNATITATGGNGSITLNAGTDLILNDSGANPDISTAGTGAINFNVVRNSLVNANVQVATAGGPIDLTTDDASIAATASLIGGIVAITPTTAGRTIDLGTNTAGRLGLTDAELDRVTATVLRIGDAAAGPIVNSAAISQAGSGYTTLSLITGADVNNGGGSIAGTNLAIRAATGIGTAAAPLATAVGTLAAVDTVSGAIQVTNTGALTIGTIDAVLGVSLVGAAADNIVVSASSPLTINADVINNTGGDIVLTATNDGGNDDNLTVNARIIASGGNGSITLNAGTDLILNDSGANPDISTAGTGAINLNVVRNALVNANVQVVTAGGPINLTTDDASISATASLSGGIVTITTTTAARVIDLGTDTAGRLGLTDAELDRITATILRIGTAANTGGIENTSPVSPAGTTVFSLQTSGAITDTAAGGITIANLAARGNGVNLSTGSHAVGTLAGASTAGFSFTNTIGLTVDTVDGAVGIVAAGPIVLTADNLTLNQQINAGANGVTLRVRTAGRAIDLGGADTAGSLGLTDAELDLVTAGVLTIGDAAAGSITNTAAITQAGSGYTTLSLITGANVANGGGSIAQANLAIRAVAGIGTAGTPLATTLGNLEATTATGGIFIGNTGNLAIGGVDAGLNGVRVTVAGDIAITSLGNISIGVNGDNVATPGAISLTANGATADLSTGGGNRAANAAVNAGGIVNLTAGRDLLLGGVSAAQFGDVSGSNITLIAARNLVLDGDTFVDATGTLVATAGQDLTVTATTNGAGPRFTTAGGTIGLTAGGVLTLAASAATAAVISNNGDITFTADSMTIDRAVNAGTGCAILKQASAARPLNLGTETAGSLSLTDAELDRITAAAIQVGRTTAAVTISAPITLSTSAVPPATGSNTLVILGSTVTETTGSLTVNTLGIGAAGAVSLDQPNTVSRLGVNTSGAVTFRGSTSLTAFTACGTAFNGIVSNNGDVIITADDLNIATPINAGTGCVIVQPLTANRPIDIGTETAGSLSLTNGELNQVTARVLRVGSATAGPISVTQAINLTTTPTLALRSGAAISEAAAGTLTVPNLGVQAGAAVTLANANSVGQLAVAAGAAIAFANTPNLVIGSVDVCDPAPLTGLTAPNAAISMTVTGAGNLLTVNNAINAGNGAIVLTADDMAINAAVNSGTQPTTLVQQTAGRAISLGADFAGSLGLTDAELDQIAAAQINIGNAASGDVTSRGPISPAGTSTLRIQTGGAIVDANAPAADITVANLALIAVNGIGSADPLDTTVNNLAFTNGANGVQIANTDNLTIASVAGVATSTSASTATITALGAATFAVNVTTTGNLSVSALETPGAVPNFSNLVANPGVTVRSTAGDVTLSAGDRLTLNGTAQAAQLLTLTTAFDSDLDGSQTLNGNLIATNVTINVGGAQGATQTGGAITADGLLLLGTQTGAFILTSAANDVNRIAAATNGAINYRDANALTVGAVSGTGGINTGGTNLTLTAGGVLTLGDGTVSPQPITAAGAVDLFAAGITQNANGPLVSDTLRIRGTGTFTLLNAGNNVNALAADVTGPLSFRDANSLTVGTVLGTAGIRVQGINANVDAVTLFVGSDLTITQVIDAGGIGGGNIVANIGQTTVGTLTQNVELSARRATFNGGNAVTPGGVGDTFLVRPSAATPITVNGNLPTVPIGDSLRLFLNQGEQGLMFTPGAVGAGTFTFTNRATIDFTGIESLNQLNLLAFVLQNGPNSFTITAQGRIEQQVSGTVPLAPIPTNPFVVSPQFVNPAQQFGAPRLAVGDVNGDGIPDLIVAFGPNNGPLVTVFDGGDVFRALPNPRILSQFFAYDPRFFGGVFVAAADFDGDGRAEIVTGADAGGGPHVRVLRFDPNVANVNLNVGDFPGPLGSFFPFAQNFTGGVRVATGDVNGDGRPDLITAAGPGGGPHVRTFNGVTGLQLAGPLGSFFAYEQSFRGGVFVAAGDYNSDGNADIMTGPGVGGSARVRILSGLNGQPLADFNAFPPPGPNFPFPPTVNGGTTPFPNEAIAFNGVGSLAFADLDGDNNLDIIVGSGRGQAARIRGFRGNRMTPIEVISDFVDTRFRDGIGVASFVDPQFGM